MVDKELDELLSEDFLDSLNDEDSSEDKVKQPLWVIDDVQHTTFKAYHTILKFKASKLTAIKNYGKVATNKTPKSLYQISKTEVAKQVEVSAQSIFRASTFSKDALAFFNEVNKELLEVHEVEQKKQLKRKNTGLRKNKKEEIVKSHQSIEEKYETLKRLKTKEMLELTIERMPLDLRVKLGL
ncbi:hypothetical protein [Vibrio sp. 10N.247.310.17]|uniref:hypothetical protein n=1 Tax=Vibrio sp. 10N.247.310.17 TaxID=3229979 RepID=UPI003550D21D